MSQQLGKIEKPESENFIKGRKIFLVPLVYSSREAPVEYVEKYELYWKQVAEQVLNLESKIGLVKMVFHEAVSEDQEDGLNLLEKLNARSYLIAKQKCENGATVVAIEDKDLAEEYVDWQRCLLMGLISEKANKMVSESFKEAALNRYEHIGKKIDETLEKDTIGILFLQEGHLVQFPQDIEVFSIAPPALDDIHRWFRDTTSKQQQAEETQ
jgi:hypothetical protein